MLSSHTAKDQDSKDATVSSARAALVSQETRERLGYGTTLTKQLGVIVLIRRKS